MSELVAPVRGALSMRVRIIIAAAATAALIAFVALAALDAHPNPLFHPHGYCYLWEPPLVAAHVGSDALIGLSYLAISLTLAYLVVAARRDIPFGWMILAFGAFIVACGATHFMDIVTLWQPLFWTSADIKIVTALASVGTALSLPPLVPKVVGLVHAAKLSESRRIALAQANQDLERRVAERTAALEGALAREQDLRGRAEAASQVKDEFLGIVSHELRTPLNAILGWSNMLAAGEMTPETQRKGAAAVERNARAQARLIDDLLDTSRAVSGRLRVHHQPMAIGPVVTAAIETTRPAADAKRITLAATDTAGGAYVVGDAQRLQQMVWNLLSNAVKFTDDGGRVDVELRRSGSRLAIVVRDTGIGVDPDFMPRLFERFSQADSSSTRPQSGLGIGLALVRHLTELHGGTVSATSDGRGHGSTFTIDLPLLSAEGVVPGERMASSGGSPTLVDLRVLVVDDDVETLEMIRSGLTDLGASVTTAVSASAARQIVATTSVDVIVSDVAMPGDDGLTLMRELRALGIDVPAIALTAQVAKEDRSRVIAAGFHMHLPKPATCADLARAIDAVRVS